jgi:alkylation response protein AidB-like acyl-CoA dehydrogenase
MDFRFTEEQELLRQTIRNFLDKECPDEYVQKCDEEGQYPYELHEKMVPLGFFGLPFPEEYGGTDGGVMEMVIMGEELGRKGYDISVSYGLTIFNGLNILRHGTEEQKNYYIPKIINGDIRVSVSITEPDAGSDVAAMKTYAALDGDHFIMNGQKVFSTAAAAKNNIIKMYCITDKNVPPRKGMSAIFVDPNSPGLEYRKLRTMGRRIMGTYELFMTDVKVPRENLLGKLNDGWNMLLSGLEFERIFTSAAYVGNAQAAVDEALEYSKQRKQFGKEIGNFQTIAHMLADMQTEVDAARLMVYRAAWLLAEGKPANKEVCMAKLFGSEVFARVTNLGMQIMGGYGYMMEYNMQRHFRDARITTVTAGTSQMQRNTIARHLGLRP